MFRHFDQITGISFLPFTEHVYQQAPYQAVSEGEYLDALEKFPRTIEWTNFSDYEKEDNTEGAATLACTGGVCEL